jgi:hypothetical protein
MGRIPKISDEKLLEDFVHWTRIYRNEVTLKGAERKKYQAMCHEIKKRGLLNGNISKRL